MRRTDIGDDRDPNPDKDEQYQQAELKSERIAGRSFAGENFAAAERQQADARDASADERGDSPDDVQMSDGDAGEADRGDVARRANQARTGLDAERRAEADGNL